MPLSALRPLSFAVLGVAVACSPPITPEPEPEPESYAAPIVRTGDPEKRGYTDDDFPRVKELAEGVYSYEQLRSAGDEKFTTVSLFVVTDDGVLVADGQGSPEETKRLVDAVAELSDQPITHVVICSDHGDHTAGNVSFPEGAVFYAHPTSKATLEAAASSPNRREDAPAGHPPNRAGRRGDGVDARR